MPDIQHTFGSDLTVGPTGDLALSETTQLTQERVLRRLLTNAGAYIWQLSYGAGLPQAIGRPANPDRIAAVIRAQMLQEAEVASSPAPAVSVVQSANGICTATIQYVDAETGTTQSFTVPVGLS
ncbi:MAG: hypothetical protein P4L71_20120 [Acetobacteraceae bacterium]|nr:hypothetical protein [Acetobacteraceae bacterium]